MQGAVWQKDVNMDREAGACSSFSKLFFRSRILFNVQRRPSKLNAE